MDKDYKQFYEDACELYFKYRDEHPDEHWEQMYFDAMEDKYDTDTEQCLIHLFYWDDDTIGGVAQGVLEDLLGKHLLRATCFDDEYRETTIVATIVKKEA